MFPILRLATHAAVALAVCLVEFLAFQRRPATFLPFSRQTASRSVTAPAATTAPVTSVAATTSTIPASGATSASASPRLLVFTFADHFVRSDPVSGGLCTLGRSLSYYGTGLNVFGWEKSMNFFDGKPCNCSNFIPQAKKFLWMENLVNNAAAARLSDDDLVMFVDGFDVIFQRNVSLAIAQYQKILGGKRGIVFNGERGCWPWSLGGPDPRPCVDAPSQKDKHAVQVGNHLRDTCIYIHTHSGNLTRKGRDMCSYLESLFPGEYRYLNSGAYMGDVQSLRNFFASSKAPSKKYDFLEDQGLTHLTMVSDPSLLIRVDTNASIWQSLFQAKDGDLARVSNLRCQDDYMKPNGPPANTRTGNVAIALHFNGYRYFDGGAGLRSSCSDVISREYNDSIVTLMDFDRKKEVTLAC